ncbi:MAG: hypothetical protein WCQ95_05105 [Bacteroidota bacterium]
MRSLKLCVILLLSVSLYAKSQVPYVAITSGNLLFLKGQTDISVEFVYDGMKVSEFTEEMYLKQKKLEFRKPADYETFISKWESERATTYEPAFVKQFNMWCTRLDLVADPRQTDTKYTMIVKTVKTEPGFYNGTNGMRRDTYVTLMVNFVATTDTNTILCSVKAEYIVGATDVMADMTNMNLKLGLAYGSAGERISKLIVKECTKKIKETPVVNESEELKQKAVEKDKKEKKGKKGKNEETNQEEE